MSTFSPLWDRLEVILPAELPAASESAQEHRRLLGWMLLTMLLAGTAGIMVHEVLEAVQGRFSADTALLVELASLGIVALAYWLNRSGRSSLAAAVIVVLCLCLVAVLAGPFLGETDSLGLLAYLLVPVIFATTMFRTVWSVATLAAVAGLAAAVPLLHGHAVAVQTGIDYAMYLAVVGSLLVLAAHHRNRIDAIRRAHGSAQEARYRFLTEKMQDVVLIMDIHAIVHYASPSLATVTGYEPQELQGHPIADLLSPASRERTMESLRNDLAAATMGAPVTPLRELECRRKDGTILFGEIHSVFLRDSAGAPVGVQAVLRDITGRKRDEEERRRLHDELRQAEKLRAIGHLAGGIAHDFNNQLAGIMACADLLRAQLADKPALRDLADMIVATCDRSSRLTHQLLAFARRGAPQAKPVDMHAVIGEVVSMLQHSIDKRIRITQRLAASPATVIGDHAQLQSALLNVALNARDAMPEGGDMIFETENTILDEEFCRRSVLGITPGAYVQVRITDTGIGMDSQVMQHIFEPFFTTKEKGKGSGMGLATVHGTVYAHKGTVTVTSAPGKGTTFGIFLPAASEGLIAAAQQERVPVQGRRARILFADDEALVLAATSKILEAAGHIVIQARDGREAVERYRTGWKEIDLVILDMAMPLMDGTETFAFLRSINPAVRVLLASGYALDTTTQELLRDGAVGFIQKPFTAEKLLSAVDDALGATPVLMPAASRGGQGSTPACGRG